MPVLPTSPRARRRLLWLTLPAVLIAAVAAVVVLIPSRGPIRGEPTGPLRPAQLASATRTKVSLADRRAIDRLLDRFLPPAMAHRNPDLVWRLAGPELRAGTTLAELRTGSSPVPEFPLAGSRFHHWQKIDAGPGYVIFNLLLHPRPHSKAATSTFSGEVVKVHGQWRVNRLYTIAIDAPITRTTHEIGPADFAAGGTPGAQSQPTKEKHSLGMIPILGILSAVFLLPLSLAVVALIRARRFKRALADRGRGELPPLPITRN